MITYNYNIIAETDEATVVSEYTPKYGKSDNYQSEADLEREFIKQLQSQGYEYIQIHREDELVANLRKQLEKLNNYTFSENEWKSFFTNVVANTNNGILEKSRIIQEDSIQVLKKDDGTSQNIKLIDKANIHNNFLQVINQYEEEGGSHNTRYDVSILVNGLPLVHVELKRRGVAIREAFNQINRYQRDSFWASSGLYEYVQIFVISNGTNTKYYSNTTRNSHIKEMEGSKTKSKKTSNSFEFTSYWADGKNKIIPDLIDFSRTFFAKHTLLGIITRYCVFTSDDILLVMRPYQICATERILNRIQISNNYHKDGTLGGGGYIWHTTGSGKTLTSFKTAQLATSLPFIDKVLFVVDRKDLDYQTMKEYDKFEKGAADGNASTAILQRQLENREKNGAFKDYRIIITTIQKLDNFVSKNKHHPIYDKHIVLIFDECHRSQFGEMRKKIVKAFKHYHIFGFTGTPIFAKNAGPSSKSLVITTEQAFGDKLHTYTIVDAINDGNVLPFHIDYVNTVKEKEWVADKDITAIDREKALANPRRIEAVVEYLLDHFDQKTKRNSYYTLKERRVGGFNSIFAVSSIPTLKKYYIELKKQIQEKHKDLVIATIFSYGANEEDQNDIINNDEHLDTEGLDKPSRDFLEEAIKEYNKTFNTNFDTSSDKFGNYYKDLSLRVKNREVDLLLVVNMFLTGFDATTLNTLWVDKNLKYHSLIQAFSRTNRILNSVKTFGNIVCFRDLEEEVNDAIALFGDKDANGIVLIKTFDEYYYGYDELDGKHVDGYVDIVAKLQQDYPLDIQIIGESAMRKFVALFGQFLRFRNILSSFDRFDEVGMRILSDREQQDYQSNYLDIYDQLRKSNSKGEKEDISDDLVFELELVKQVEVNIDYILMLVEQYHSGNCEDREILAKIKNSVSSSPQLRSKKELIEGFIDSINVDTVVDRDWRTFVIEQQKVDLGKIIQEENLKEEETKKFVANAFRDGAIKENGTEIDEILPPMSRFGKGGNNRAKKKVNVLERLKKFFEKYFGLGIFEV